MSPTSTTTCLSVSLMTVPVHDVIVIGLGGRFGGLLAIKGFQRGGEIFHAGQFGIVFTGIGAHRLWIQGGCGTSAAVACGLGGRSSDGSQ